MKFGPLCTYKRALEAGRTHRADPVSVLIRRSIIPSARARIRLHTHTSYVRTLTSAAGERERVIVRIHMHASERELLLLCLAAPLGCRALARARTGLGYKVEAWRTIAFIPSYTVRQEAAARVLLSVYLSLSLLFLPLSPRIVYQ